MVMSQEVWVICIYVHFQPEITDKESTESTKKVFAQFAKKQASNSLRSQTPAFLILGKSSTRTSVFKMFTRREVSLFSILRVI